MNKENRFRKTVNRYDIDELEEDEEGFELISQLDKLSLKGSTKPDVKSIKIIT